MQHMPNAHLGHETLQHTYIQEPRKHREMHNKNINMKQQTHRNTEGKTERNEELSLKIHIPHHADYEDIIKKEKKEEMPQEEIPYDQDE